MILHGRLWGAGSQLGNTPKLLSESSRVEVVSFSAPAKMALREIATTMSLGIDLCADLIRV